MKEKETNQGDEGCRERWGRRERKDGERKQRERGRRSQEKINKYDFTRGKYAA